MEVGITYGYCDDVLVVACPQCGSTISEGNYFVEVHAQDEVVQLASIVNCPSCGLKNVLVPQLFPDAPSVARAIVTIQCNQTETGTVNMVLCSMDSDVLNRAS